MHWFKKGIYTKYPSTIYISLNKQTYSEIDVVSEYNQQAVISMNSSSLQNDINSESINSSPEVYQV